MFGTSSPVAEQRTANDIAFSKRVQPGPLQCGLGSPPGTHFAGKRFRSSQRPARWSHTEALTFSPRQMQRSQSRLVAFGEQASVQLALNARSTLKSTRLRSRNPCCEPSRRIWVSSAGGRIRSASALRSCADGILSWRNLLQVGLSLQAALVLSAAMASSAAFRCYRDSAFERPALAFTGDRAAVIRCIAFGRVAALPFLR